jgi:hypothetical protein
MLLVGTIITSCDNDDNDMIPNLKSGIIGEWGGWIPDYSENPIVILEFKQDKTGKHSIFDKEGDMIREATFTYATTANLIIRTFDKLGKDTLEVISLTNDELTVVGGVFTRMK